LDTKRLVELLVEVPEPETGRSLEGVVVLEQSQANHGCGKFLAACRVGDSLHILHQARDVQKAGHWSPFLVFLVDHHGGPNAAVGMAAATHLSPLSFGAVHQIGKVCERADE
jgi:hypothetical protein